MDMDLTFVGALGTSNVLRRNTHGLSGRTRFRHEATDNKCRRHGRCAIKAIDTSKDLSSSSAETKSPFGYSSSAAESSEAEGINLRRFLERAQSQPDVRMVPLWRRVFADQVTPVELFRCLVAEDDTSTHAFLLESATNDGTVGRYSFVGSSPSVEVISRRNQVKLRDMRSGSLMESEFVCDDPWKYIADFMADMKCAEVSSLPETFSGGWVGYGGYDTARYAESRVLPFSNAPKDDRNLPEMHMGLYQSSIVVDHFAKMLIVVEWVDLQRSDTLELAYSQGMSRLNSLVSLVMKQRLQSPLQGGYIDLDTFAKASVANDFVSNMSKEEFVAGVEKCLYHIREGDAFQIVLSQRFEHISQVDPFSVYRALRVINPSPYMIYMQCEGSVLVASSPEILCRVKDGIMVNRPLAGTRWRGKTEEEDLQLEKELLSDEKERAEHIMLVDLGRNDLGRVAEYGSIEVARLMEVERYSHVMHISSTVYGKLREGMTSWDALRSTLPAGTVSGAPKIRAMQIIDTIETSMRGPYGGGIGFVSFQDHMNMALGLRTMVIRKTEDGKWNYHIQAGAGLVGDSDPEKEYQETVNKAMALARAIDLAEQAFL